MSTTTIPSDIEIAQAAEIKPIGIVKRVDLPLDWADQRAQLGFD